MATRRFKISPGVALVVEEAGAAVNSHLVELTVECASTAMDGGTRQISRQEVLDAITKLQEHVTLCPWPPV